MNQTAKAFLLVFLLGLLICPIASALTGEEILRLKKAGVDDKTIELIIQNKADLTGSIDVDEVVKMKQAGVSDSVIQAMATPHDNPERVKVYGTNVDPLNDLSTGDLQQLRDAGFDDSMLESVMKIQKQQLWPYLFDVGVVDCPGWRGRPYRQPAQ